MADFCSSDFAVSEAHASLKQCVTSEVILHLELKQGYQTSYIAKLYSPVL